MYQFGKWPINSNIILILVAIRGIFIRISSRPIEVALVLLITLLGASIIPASAQEAGETNLNELDENQTGVQVASDANMGTDLLTNRRKPLTADSSLAEAATEDVIDPEKPESIVVVRAGSGDECRPEIGLTYKDSTPCDVKSEIGRASCRERE